MSVENDIETAPPSAGRFAAYLMLIVFLGIAWVLWSGMFKPLLLGLGLFSCVLTVFLAHRMGYFHSGFFALRFSLRLIGYWLWLLKEILVSSIEVTRVVLARHLNLSTKVVELDASTLDTVDQAVLGNSITLTPGTLTLDITDGKIRVHALTQDGADGVLAGTMLRRVAELRRR